MMGWTRQRGARACAVLVALALWPLAGCSDDNGDGGQDSVDICASDTLSVSLATPADATGFAPFSVQLQGQVSLLQTVDYQWVFDFGDGQQLSGTNTQPLAQHQYQEANESGYEVKLTVTDAACGKTYEATTTIIALPKVELTGADLTVTPANVQVEQEIQVSARVINTSQNDLTVPLNVEFFLSTRPGVFWNEVEQLVPLSSVTVQPQDGVTLLAGAQRILQETMTIPRTTSSGTYYVIAAIDLGEEIGEEVDEESNNIVASQSPVVVINSRETAPDLVVEQVLVGPSTAFRELREISVNADVRNIGTGFAEGVAYAVYLHETEEFDPGSAQVLLTSEPVNLDFVAPQNEIEVRGERIVLNPAITSDDLTLWVTVCADPAGAVAEGPADDTEMLAEQNNCATGTTTIRITDEVLEGTDIVLVNLDVSPKATFLDGTVQVTMEVTNFGTTATGSFFCGIYLSEDEDLSLAEDVALTNINFSTLQPDQTRETERIVTIPGFYEIGQYSIFGFCDPSNIIRENFEDNNSKLLDEKLTIAAEAIIDLIITDFTLEPTELENGGTLRASVTVRNEGSSGSGPTEVVLRRSLDDVVGVTDPILGRATLPALGPQSETALEIVLEGVECEIFKGTYRIGAHVDPFSLVPELNPNNNEVTLESPLSITGARCVCEADEFEPNETPATAVPVPDGAFADLTMCNPGERDYLRVNLAMGQSLTVRMMMEYEGACSNLDLKVLDPNFQTIPSTVSRNDGPMEQADLFLVQQPGDYTVEVAGRANCDVNRYALEIVITDPTPGIDLTGTALSVNNTEPALLEPVTLTYTLLNIGSDDAGSHQVVFYLTQDQEVSQADLVLGSVEREEHAGARILYNQTSTFPIPREATEGSYYICAAMDGGNDLTESNEDNNVFCSDQITVDTSCFDAYEVNNTPMTATRVEPGVYENLSVCNNNRPDYFLFCADSGSEVEVSVDFVHADGDIDLTLYDVGPDGMGTRTELGSSATTNNREAVALNYVNGDRCFLVYVQLQDRNSTANSYTLNVLVEAGDPALACDQHFEPNDNAQQSVTAAANLLHIVNGEDAEGNPVPQTLDRCPNDPQDIDYYYLDLVAGPTVTLCVENSDQNPQEYVFNLTMTGPAPAQTQVGFDLDTNPCITYRVTVTGRYFVRVLAPNRDRRNIRYNFTLDGLLGVDLTTGGTLALDPADVIPGETFLFYSFELRNARQQAAQGVEYGLYYSTDPVIDPQDDLLLEMKSVADLEGFSNRAESGVVLVPDSELIVRGRGYFGVVLDPDNQVTEDLENNNTLSAQANLIVCDEDAFTGNQSPESAALIELGTTYEDLSVCPATSDWFCLEALPAGEYTAEALFALSAPNDTSTDLQLQVVTVDEERSLVELLGRHIQLADNAAVPFVLVEEADVCVQVRPSLLTGANNYSLTVRANTTE